MGFKWNSAAVLSVREPSSCFLSRVARVHASPLSSSLGGDPSAVLKPSVFGVLLAISFFWDWGRPLLAGWLSMLDHVKTLWIWTGSYGRSWGSFLNFWQVQNFDRAAVGIPAKICICWFYKQGAAMMMSVAHQYVRLSGFRFSRIFLKFMYLLGLFLGYCNLHCQTTCIWSSSSPKLFHFESQHLE